MKHMNKFLVAFLIVGVLSSCTQRRYSHITGFQFNKKAKTEKTVRSGHYVDTKNQINPIANKEEVEVQSETTPVISNELPAIHTERKQIAVAKVVRDFTTAQGLQNTVDTKTLPEALQEVSEVVAPQGVVKKVKKAVSKKTKAGGLIYWILVLILLLLIIALLESILGQWLTRLLILIVLLAFVGHLLGLW